MPDTRYDIGGNDDTFLEGFNACGAVDALELDSNYVAGNMGAVNSHGTYGMHRHYSAFFRGDNALDNEANG